MQEITFFGKIHEYGGLVLHPLFLELIMVEDVSTVPF
jgi:hypothetical protein